MASELATPPLRAPEAPRVERLRALLGAHFSERWAVAHHARALGVTAGQLGVSTLHAITGSVTTRRSASWSTRS